MHGSTSLTAHMEAEIFQHLAEGPWGEKGGAEESEDL